MYEALSSENVKKSREEYALEDCLKSTQHNWPTMFYRWARWMCPAEVKRYRNKDEFGNFVLDAQGHSQWKTQLILSDSMIMEYMSKPKRLGEKSAKERFVIFCRKHGLKPSWSLIYPFVL